MSNSIQGKTVPVDLELTPTDTRRVWVHVFRDRHHAIPNETKLSEDLVAFEGKGQIATTISSLGRSGTPTLCVGSKSLLELQGNAASFGTTRPLPVHLSVRDSLRVFPRWSARRSSRSIRTDSGTALKNVSWLGRRTSTWTCCVLTGRTRWKDASSFPSWRSRFCPTPGDARERRRNGQHPHKLCERVSWNSLMSFLSPVKVIYGGNECRFAEIAKW